MVEPILYFVLGFLAASLVALAFLRAVWGRAVRLTILRLASRLPVSPAMIVADRDRLRAAHAIETRKLERRVEALGAESAEYRATAARDKAELRRMTADLLEARTQLGVVEMREVAATDQRGRPAMPRALPDPDTEALRATVADLTAEIAAAKAEFEARQGLETDVSTRLAELETENARLIEQLETAGPAVLQELENTIESLRVEKTSLEVALDGLRTDRDDLQHRLGELENARVAAEATESEENLLLRNRLNSLAADIVKWTAPTEADATLVQGGSEPQQTPDRTPRPRRRRG
jgi:chromosome segregation ATPase